MDSKELLLLERSPKLRISMKGEGGAQDAKSLLVSVKGPMVDQVAEVTLWWPPVLGGNVAPRGREALRLPPTAPSTHRTVA